MTTPAVSPPSLTRYAWIVVGLLWPVALLNYMDRQMLAAMKTSVMADIPDLNSEAQWGLLPAWFKWVYALVSPLGGYLADRFNKKMLICMSLFVWSLITWATGHAQNYEQLVWTRALMGISEACYIPAALALIADFHPGETRSRAVGFHQMAIYVGIIVGGFSGYAADAPHLGWRWAFDMAGLVGMAYAVPLFFLLRNAPRGTEGMARPAVGPTLAALAGNRQFWMLVACFTLPALAGWVVKDWMPAILKEQFNIGQGRAGVSSTLYVNVASLLGAVLGGVLADRWMRTSLRGRTHVSALGMVLMIPALFGVGNAGALWVAVVFLALFGLGWGFFDCNNMPILCQIVRPEHRATGYGLMNLVSISCGGFADWGFGVLRDMSLPLNVIFAAFAALAACSAVLMWLIRPRDELAR